MLVILKCPRMRRLGFPVLPPEASLRQVLVFLDLLFVLGFKDLCVASAVAVPARLECSACSLKVLSCVAAFPSLKLARMFVCFAASTMGSGFSVELKGPDDSNRRTLRLDEREARDRQTDRERSNDSWDRSRGEWRDDSWESWYDRRSNRWREAEGRSGS